MSVKWTKKSAKMRARAYGIILYYYFITDWLNASIAWPTMNSAPCCLFIIFFLSFHVSIYVSIFLMTIGGADAQKSKIIKLEIFVNSILMWKPKMKPYTDVILSLIDRRLSPPSLFMSAASVIAWWCQHKSKIANYKSISHYFNVLPAWSQHWLNRSL